MEGLNPKRTSYASADFGYVSVLVVIPDFVFRIIVNITRENFLCIEDKIWLIYSSIKTDVNVRLPLIFVV